MPCSPARAPLYNRDGCSPGLWCKETVDVPGCPFAPLALVAAAPRRFHPGPGPGGPGRLPGHHALVAVDRCSGRRPGGEARTRRQAEGTHRRSAPRRGEAESGTGPRLRRRRRLAQHRRADPAQGPARQDRPPRLLDPLLHQLHPRPARPGQAGKEVRQRARRHRRPLAQVRQREEHREHPQGDPALRDQPSGRQRRQTEDLATPTASSPGRPWC